VPLSSIVMGKQKGQLARAMTNNDILKKLRIALELKDTDIIEILKLADFEITKSELSALFRNPDHRNYKECGDQILRNFLNGLIIRNRGKRP
jgi:uncharacterized protein YehS (DUF1456 family)